MTVSTRCSNGLFNKTNIDKLSALSEIVAKYNRDVNKIRKYTDDYLATINEFMHDSGKKIAFNNNGESSLYSGG